jgi:L-ascorbate metabolism protein UlaG (beta-lactamase superfamily)
VQPEITITWVGHATVLLEIDGFRVITDPILTSRVVHLRRRVAVPAIEPVDAVLISHLHMDHLHLRSLHMVSNGARVIAPAGSAKLFRSLGARQLDEVVAGDILTLRAATADTPAIELQVVPADHSNARGPHSRIVAEPVGYIIGAGGRSVYFAGDTDLFDGMADLGGPIDLALLPVWGWGPTLGRGLHMDPLRAAESLRRIRPRAAVPIHWGTYWPHAMGRVYPDRRVEPPAAFAEYASELAPDVRVLPTEVGTTVEWRA